MSTNKEYQPDSRQDEIDWLATTEHERRIHLVYQFRPTVVTDTEVEFTVWGTLVFLSKNCFLVLNKHEDVNHYVMKRLILTAAPIDREGLCSNSVREDATTLTELEFMQQYGLFDVMHESGWWYAELSKLWAEEVERRRANSIVSLYEKERLQLLQHKPRFD